MIKSMTGYGYGRYGDDILTVEAEVKAINHRYSDICIHLPKELNCLEYRIKKAVQNRFSRGHFDVWIKIEQANGGQNRQKLNIPAVKAYLDDLHQLQQELQLPGEIGIDFLKDNLNLFTQAQTVPAGDVFPQVEQALFPALDSVEQMRSEEGRTIYEELNRIIKQIKCLLAQIDQHTPRLVDHYRARLTQKVNRLASQLNIEEERLAQEVAIYAERSDISEEILRLDSHLNQLLAFLEAEGAIGKKIDFLIQEMNREINTIGSKVSDVSISEQVVEIRSFLEKIREQIQNIE
jgi:uncharacterized protein (TIGR00255 family)